MKQKRGCFGGIWRCSEVFGGVLLKGRFVRQKRYAGLGSAWTDCGQRLRLRNRVGRARCSASAVDLGFENPDLLDQRTECRRVGAEDAGDAHGVVVGFEAGKLVGVGDEPEATVQATIVAGV